MPAKTGACGLLAGGHRWRRFAQSCGPGAGAPERYGAHGQAQKARPGAGRSLSATTRQRQLSRLGPAACMRSRPAVPLVISSSSPAKGETDRMC
jgi:hypothetical protein